MADQISLRGFTWYIATIDHLCVCKEQKQGASPCYCRTLCHFWFTCGSVTHTVLKRHLLSASDNTQKPLWKETLLSSPSTLDYLRKEAYDSSVVWSDLTLNCPHTERMVTLNLKMAITSTKPPEQLIGGTEYTVPLQTTAFLSLYPE